MANLAALTDNSTNSSKLITIINNSVPTRYHGEIKDAIKFMKKEHRGQKRISGEAFYYHPLNVAAIISLIGMDTTTIIASLLHSTPYHNTRRKPEETLQMIEERFGSEVANMISTVGGYSEAIYSDSDNEMKIEYIIRSSEDLRPIFIKIADRLHNARTIDVLPHKERVRKSRDLLSIYSPLVEYMNQYAIKTELEEIAFRILNPKEYKEIEESMLQIKKNAELAEDEILNFLELNGAKVTGFKPAVYGRLKGYYSIHNKMNQKRFNSVIEIMDLYAFTTVFENIEQCYSFAKFLSRNTDFMLEHYDDYIRHPKSNGYKAIHIHTIIDEIIKIPIEIHINTDKMHNFNIYGPASHLSYKYSKPGTREEQAKYYWVKQIHSDLYNYFRSDSSKKSRPIPNDAFSSKIYVFTPENILTDLPVGSTAVDFAYKIHSNLGNKASGVIVNGKKQDLSIMLKNGDRVEILVDEKKELPEREWLKFVRTKKARDEIENEYKRYLLGKDVDFTHAV